MRPLGTLTPSWPPCPSGCVQTFVHFRWDSQMPPPQPQDSRPEHFPVTLGKVNCWSLGNNYTHGQNTKQSNKFQHPRVQRPGEPHSARPEALGACESQARSGWHCSQYQLQCYQRGGANSARPGSSAVLEVTATERAGHISVLCTTFRPWR